MPGNHTGRRRAYSETEKANALALLSANGGNVRSTARQLGLPPRTLGLWHATESAAPPEVREGRRRANAEFAERLLRLAEICLGVVMDKADEMNGLDAAKAAGIAIDRWLRLIGEPERIALETAAPQDEARARRVAERYLNRRPPRSAETEPEG